MRLYFVISIGVFWDFLGVYVFDQFLFPRGNPVSVAIAMFVWSTECSVVTDGVYICHFRYGEFDLRLPTSDTFHGSACLCHTRVVMRSGVS